ncbi:MAG TPA: phage tail protein [Patescibacteria group bacterium]|nr:phage tail protein [Patescibacteria group bacterium]
MYSNFRFRIRHEGRHVAGFSVIDAPRTPAAPITLERGVTHDAEFEQWASRSGKREGEAGPRDLEIDVFNEEGRQLASYHLRGCRISKYLGMPYMDSRSVAIRTLRIDNDGWSEQDS